MKIKKSMGVRIFNVVNITLMMLFVLMCIYPFYYMLIYSFSDPNKAYNLTLLPKEFTLSNYKQVFGLAGFGRASVVSLARTLVGTGVTVLCCGFFGYLMTKQNMLGRKVMYRLMLVTMYVDGGLIPTFLVYNAYGLTNSYWVYILPAALSAYNVILIKTFMEQIPASLEESAKLDGAGPVRCWWSVVMPLSKPILATIAVFSAVGQWNSWFDAHIYITEKKMWPLQYVLYRYLQQIQNLAAQLLQKGSDTHETLVITPAAVRMTLTAVITIPILFVYPFMQRYFMKGIMLGAVKG